MKYFWTKAAAGPVRAALAMVLVTTLSPCVCKVLPDITPVNQKLSKQQTHWMATMKAPASNASYLT